MLHRWMQGLPSSAHTGDDPTLTMVASATSRMKIEEELGLQATKAELGLQDEIRPVPLGRDDRFLVRRLLGRGSMGAVYLADDLRLNREVALKVVAPHRIEHGQLERRLEREAQALAALRHENVVQVYDLATTDAGELFIAMEYVPGTTLRCWQAERGLDEILAAYLDAGRGLAAAHARGIVHRDFKPDNVLLDHEAAGRRVLVSDFGLAGIDPDARNARPRPTRGLLTSSRGLLGTLAYMAPEQLRRDPADSRSDQHQYCVALWEAIARERPFPDDGRALDPQAGLPPRPSAMPRWVHRVLERGLAFERDDRYPSMGELLAALERGRRWRRARPWVAAIGLLGATGLGAWQWLQPDPCEDATTSMSEIWTEEARREVGAAFRGLGTSYADTLASHVVGRLDRAAAGWTARAVEVCEARVAVALPDEALDRRKACLDRWRVRMSRRVELLRSAGSDPAVVDHAHELVASLDSEAECRFPSAPIDPRVEVAVEEAEEHRLLGRSGEALERAKAAVELATATATPCQGDGERDREGRPYSSELAAALFGLGRLQRDQGHTTESLESLELAHLHALACDDGHRFADARIHAAKILAVDLGQLEDAGLALREAEVQLGRLGEPSGTARRREQWKAAGLIAQRDGRHEDARAFHLRGLEALGDPSAHPVEAAKLIHDIGITFQAQGRHAEAQAAYDRAVELVATALGEDHAQTKERVARQALHTALLAVDHRQFDAARRRFAVAVEHGPPIIAAKAYTAWAQSEYEAGAMALAEQASRELLVHLHEHPDLAPEVMAQGMGTAGQVIAARGDPAAIELLDEAIRRWTALGDEQSLLFTRFLRTQALHTLQRDVEARRDLERLLEEPGVMEGALAEPVELLAESLGLSPSTPSKQP